MKTDAQTRADPFKIRTLFAATVVAISLAPVCAHAQNAPSRYGDGAFVSWLNMVSATQAAQPSWMTPLVTVTPRLEQEFRFDAYNQQNGKGSQGNGQQITSYGGPGGVRLELIPAYNWEVILAAPPYATATGPKDAGQGWGDWPAFLVKYRLLSANKDNGDYIVTAFFQMSDPLNAPAKISNNILAAQPTLAFGKGWGDFDIQSTVSVQVPVAALNAPGSPAATTFANFGDPFLWNTAFQYHLFEYFWPQIEVNYEVWPNGQHVGLNQVLLTPGLILGRFRIGMDSPTRPINLIVGAGYQVAVTPNPVVQNNFVGTIRITF